MTPHVAPALGSDAYNCPHRRLFASNLAQSQNVQSGLQQHPRFVQCPTRSRTGVSCDGINPGKQNVQSPDNGIGGLAISECEHCSKPTLWLGEVILWPKHGTAPPPHPDFPDNIRCDYDEASAIAGDSPRASSGVGGTAVEDPHNSPQEQPAQYGPSPAPSTSMFRTGTPPYLRPRKPRRHPRSGAFRCPVTTRSWRGRSRPPKSDETSCNSSAAAVRARGSETHLEFAGCINHTGVGARRRASNLGLRHLAGDHGQELTARWCWPHPLTSYSRRTVETCVLPL